MIKNDFIVKYHKSLIVKYKLGNFIYSDSLVKKEKKKISIFK